MTEMILRIFTKKYDNTEENTMRLAIGKFSGTVGIVFNVLLFLGKFVAGFISGSLSISADAFNNLTDAISSVVTFLGFRMAQQPADKDHPYGHARYEYLAGLILSAFILFVGFELIKTSVSRIIKPVSVDISVIAVTVLVLSVIVKAWMCLFYRALSKKIGSVTLMAASADSRNDVLATTAVLLGYIAEYWFKISIDGYIGLLVAIFIIKSGFDIAKEEISLLLGKQVDNDTIEKIGNIVLSNEKVLGIHDMLIHDYGPGRCYASVHAEFDASESLIVCHDIADNIEKQIAEEMNIELVIHFDPVVLDDEERNRLELIINEIAEGINKDMSVHDFRMARKDDGTTLMFDIFVPYEMDMSREDIKKAIDMELLKKDIDYKTEIRFDGKK